MLLKPLLTLYKCCNVTKKTKFLQKCLLDCPKVRKFVTEWHREVRISVLRVAVEIFA